MFNKDHKTIDWKDIYDKGRGEWRDALSTFDCLKMAKLSRPQVGDLVMETSSFAEIGFEHIGFLTDVDYNNGNPKYQIIQAVDGKPTTWENCSFKVIDGFRLCQFVSLKEVVKAVAVDTQFQELEELRAEKQKYKIPMLGTVK